MLVELSVMEQRYQAALAVVQDGGKVVEFMALAASCEFRLPEEAAVPNARRCSAPVAGRQQRRRRPTSTI